MRSTVYVLFFLIIQVLLVSCKTERENVEEYPNWQATNEVYFASKADSVKNAIASGNRSWKMFSNTMKVDSACTYPTDYVLVQVITEGSGTESPLFTDSVKVAYEGRLLPSTSYSQGYIFQKTYDGENFYPETAFPARLMVSGTIVGMQTALQHMHVGDRWRVFIPYQMGYGSAGTTGVPAYSTLIFDMYLGSFFHRKIKE